MRYTLFITFSEVTDVVVDDTHRIQELFVGSVSYDPAEGLLILEGSIPGSIKIRTRIPEATVAKRDKPDAIKKWFRWWPLESAESPSA